MCGPGKQCTKEILPPPTTSATTTVTTAPPFVPDECDSLEDGVCYQLCPEGSCVLECFNSTYYNSCAQSCNGEGLISVIACVNFLEFVSQKVISLIWQFLLKNNILIYYIDTSVLLENTTLAKFIRHYIRDSISVFPISSLVKISMISLMRSKHLRVFLESLPQSSEILGNACLAFGTILENLGKSSENRQKRRHQYVYNKNITRKFEDMNFMFS